MSDVKECRKYSVKTACVLWLGTQIDNVPKFDEYIVEKNQQKKDNKVYMRNKSLSPNWLYSIDGSIHYLYTGVTSIAGVSVNYPTQFNKFLKIHGQKFDEDDNYYLIISALKLVNISNYDKMSGFERFENQNPDIRYIQYLIASISLNKLTSPIANNANDFISDVVDFNITNFSTEMSSSKINKRTTEKKKAFKKTFDYINKKEDAGKGVTLNTNTTVVESSNQKDADSLPKNECEKKDESNFEKWLLRVNAKSTGSLPLPKNGYDNLESLIKDIKIDEKNEKCGIELDNSLPVIKCDNLVKRNHNIYHEPLPLNLRKKSKSANRSEHKKKLVD